MENFCKIQIQNWTEIEHRSLSMDMIDAYFNACNIFYLSNQYLISNNSFWTWKLFVEAGRADNQKIICYYFWKAQHFYAQVSFVSKIDDDSSNKSNVPFESWICQNERQQPNGSEFVAGYTGHTMFIRVQRLGPSQTTFKHFDCICWKGHLDKRCKNWISHDFLKNST